MSIGKFFEGLTARFVKRDKTLTERWTTAVEQIADGKPPTEAVVEELLIALHRTPTDLEAAVELCIKRRAARVKVDALRTVNVEAERTKIAASVKESGDQLEQDWQAASARHQQRLAPLKQAEAAINKLVKEGDEAENFLINSVADDNLREEIARVEKELTLVKQKHGLHLNKAEYADRQQGPQLRILETRWQDNWGSGAPGTLEKERAQQEIKKLEEAKKQHEADAAQLAPDVERLERTLCELRAKQLVA